MNPASRLVLLKDDRPLAYDYLVLATGVQAELLSDTTSLHATPRA